MNKIILIFVTLIFTGCLTRAPSDNELDKRSGLSLSESKKIREFEKKEIGSKFKLSGKLEGPQRRAPQVEKIWIYDQVLGGTVLQGTWLWIEVDKGGWETSSANDSLPLLKKPF